MKFVHCCTGLLLAGLLACAPDVELPPVVDAHGASVPRDSLARELRLFTWPDYIDPALLEEFTATYGARVVVDFYDTNEALIAKLLAGGAGQYDVIIASDYAVEALRADSLLLPLREENLPNLRNLEPRFRTLPHDSARRFTATYQWGTTGLGVRADLGVDTTAPSWSMVFRPRPGTPIAMMADARETIGAALLFLGHSPNSVDSTELARAEALLLAQRPRVLTYAAFATGRDLLASGDVHVSHNFSGDVLMARQEVPGIRYLIPREGAILWTDNMAVPAGTSARRTAEAFINFVLDGEVGARLSNFTRYATPNAAALPHVDAALLEDRAVFPDSATMQRLHVLRDLGPARAAYDRIWTRVRGS